MKLYSYYRSSAAYRVRIALNLKGLDYETIPVHLVKNGGAHKAADFLELNPQGLIPVLVDDGESFAQSLAIIEYLDEQYPDIPLLPSNPRDRAHVRALALAIACDTHPLNNLRVLSYIRKNFNQTEDAINAWYRHWITTTFSALEQLVSESGGDYCFGNSIGMADIFLIPQMANAKRYQTNLDAFPRLVKIDNMLAEHPAFQSAAPENQPDAE